EFTNEIIEAIKQRATGRFKDKYRNAELLLVDDIQFLSGKETAQEEFFHTFNVIQREGGQIVVTSDRPPAEIKRIEDRLRSRFEGGLTVDVQPPDFELRCAILKIKAGQKGAVVSDEVVRILAGNFTNTRALEGALSRLLTICELKKIPVGPETAYEVAGRKEERQEPLLKIAPKEILEAVAECFSLKTSVFRSQTREQKVALPRQILMYLLRTEVKMPLMEIADFLNRKDHTTIIHGVKKITGLLSTSETVRENVENIRKKLRG
ncbi:MAG: DnaA/Hda family protein, partial [bacterium]|nr:DnaA/Hda family protein [bacterium]